MEGESHEENHGGCLVGNHEGNHGGSHGGRKP